MAAHLDTAACDSWSPLDDVACDLKRYLNISNLKPLLREKRLLTDDEFEQVEISSANPTSQAIDKFISILKTKAPDHSEKLLEVMKLSLQQEDYHLGHQFLSQRLETAIVERKAVCGERSRQVAALQEAVGAIAIRGSGHPVIRPNDSGVFPGASSTDSSQETGSPLSTPSYSTYNGGGPHYRANLPIVRRQDSALAPFHAFDEQQLSKMKQSIFRQMNNISKKFAVMVLGIYRLLKDSKTPVDEISIMLQYLGCTTMNKSTVAVAGQQRDGVKMFTGSDEICQARDLHRLMECLKQYSSWYNYRLVKEVAEEFTRGRKEVDHRI